MSGTTSVPRPQFGDNGFVAPAESDIYNGVFADINAAFGGGLNPAPETPQGQLSSSEAAIIGDGNDQFLALANGVDPAFASGRMQDGIARIYFLERLPARPTVVAAVCSGLVGKVIKFGSQAVAQDGNVYVSQDAGTIDGSGSVTLPFACTIAGPIVCAEGSLNRIYQIQPGWESITNPAPGVIGTNIESRTQFEYRRQNSVAVNSRGAASSVLGGVLAVPNVIDAYVFNNFTGNPLALDGVTVPAHSLYVCVAGGDAQAVAQAIYSKKGPGGMAGSTIETVLDTGSGYQPPYPSYTIKFQTATPQDFVILISLKSTPSLPPNATQQIRNVVLDAWSGADGGDRARIHALITAARFAGAIVSQLPWARVIDAQLGSDLGPAATFQGIINGNTLTVSSLSGTISNGDVVHGAGVLPGTVVLGGTGPYTVAQFQTVGSEVMSVIRPNLEFVQVGEAHVPVIDTDNILVELV